MTPREKFIAFKTIVRKECIRFMRIWTQTLLPPVVTQSLYFAIFGKFIGSQIEGVRGIPYMAFIVPGLVMMAVINSSFANVVGSFFSSKFQRNVEEWMVSPTPNWVVLAGYTGGGILRGVCVGVIVFGVSIFFTKPVIFHPWFIIIFMILTSILFSLGGLLNGVFARNFDEISIFPTFVLTPLIYLGGVFYSIYSLPEFWQNLSKLNPILYMINGFRYGFYGVTDVNIGLSIGIVTVLIVMLIAINLYLLEKGIRLRT